MHLTRNSRYSFILSLLAVAAVGLTAAGTQAQGTLTTIKRPELGERVSPAPKSAPGELLVRVAPGTDIEVVARQAGMTVKRKLRFAPNSYVLRGSGATAQAAAGIRNIAGVTGVSANHYFRPAAAGSVDVNDPLRDLQWPLDLTGAPGLWDVTVGQRLVDGPVETALVAVLDYAIATSHPDLAENINPNGFDFLLDQPYDESQAQDADGYFHGTAVSSCIAAVTNNNEGLASYPWEAVEILPCRVGDFVIVNNNPVPVIPADAVVDAIYYCIQAEQLIGEGVDVINLSFFTEPAPFSDQPLVAQAIADAYNAGIVVVAATGNGGFFTTGVQFPANLPEVIPVGAVGSAGEPAFYSQFGPELLQNGLAAPGGNDPNFSDIRRNVIVAFGRASYAATQGTSFAAAYVSGALATLITQGARDEALSPTEQVEALRDLLRSSARQGPGSPSEELGAGILDVAAAIRAISPVIEVFTPQRGEITESLAEPIQARIVQPDGSPLADGLFEVFRNGDDVTAEVEILPTAPDTFEWEPDAFSRHAIGANTINIVAFSAVGPAVRSLEGPAVLDSNGIVRIPARSYRFRVLPRVEQPGLKLFSVPYELQSDADDLLFVFGGNLIRLARWLPERQAYAIWDEFGAKDPEAELTTDSSGVAQPPIGTGFWARVVATTQVQILGRTTQAARYRIPVKFGFNLIGTPFTFRVPFNVLSVQYGNEVFSIQEAAKRKIISSAIWRFEDTGQTFRYTFKVLPQGELIPWEAHWIQVLKNDRPVELIVPRVGSTGTSASAVEPAGGDGWKASLVAEAGGRVVGEAILGAGTEARDGFGIEDVAHPPAAPTGYDLRIRHTDWGRNSGNYACDIRRDPQKTHRWNLELETSRPGTAVKLSWREIPAGHTAYVQVAGERRKRRIDPERALEFVPERAGIQKLTVTVVPESKA